ncbi:unnamed protein product [Blepharisma stoltei]|uniref:Uncharacterized protein n=1 Tax=Blepharisma stoltei TaxID=1481888 RepID=A0AAU9K0I8_9CILI|nr:unnamed protein product [Blepharisma stoltei]
MESEDNEIDLLANTKLTYSQVFDLATSKTSDENSATLQNQSIWKILILDELSSLSLTTLIHISSLRKHNITLYLSLNSQREPLASAIAIYLIEPTEINIQQLIRDMTNRLYDAYQIDFLYHPSQEIIQMLRKGLSDATIRSKLLKMCVFHLNYIVLEEKLFCLNGPSFEDLYFSSENWSLYEKIAMGLFSILKTCKIRPIIKATKGMSQQVASSLARLCWDDHEEIHSLSRPLLLIVDRKIDFSVMLHHPWTYQALASDVFEYESNKLLLSGEPALLYELDKTRDKFWKLQGDLPFNDILGNIEQSVSDWKEKYDAIDKNFKETIGDVAEITEEKKILDTHMSIASRLVNEVHARNLHNFSQNEAYLMHGQTPADEEFLKNQSENDTEEFKQDLLRYEIIKFLHGKKENISEENILRFLESTREEVKQTTKMKLITGLAKKLKDNLMGHEQWFPITKFLYQAMKNTGTELETYDSMEEKGGGYKREFNEAILFVIGGGSYTEYCNLNHFSKEFNKTVIYGSTEIYSPNKFLEQLKKAK